MILVIVLLLALWLLPIGMLCGAVIGWLVAGPVGAIFGAIAGAWFDAA